MKRLNTGFTLAEVTTALMIVGVVATLVIPMVAKNIQRSQAGPVLGRAVEQIESGNQNIIQMANERSDVPSYALTLSMVSLDGENIVLDNNFKESVSPYWGLQTTAIDSNDIIAPKENVGNGFDLNANVAMKAGRARCYNFAKFPATACISGNFNVNEETTTVLDAKTGLIVYIDTNGAENRPNRVGADIFGFDLLNNGHLKPTSTGDAGQFARRVVEAGYRIDY